MTQFTTRAYNKININSSTLSSVIKSSTEDRLKNEADYYKEIPSDLSIYYPRLLSYNYDNNNHLMELEYYAYDNLGNLVICSEFNKSVWDKVMSFLFKYLDNCSKHTLKTSNDSDSRAMYIDKTEKEYSALVNNFPFFAELSKLDALVFNGVELKSFELIWPTIKEYIINEHCTNKFNIIHGDLCFSNILCGINPLNSDVVLKFIDPRGTFGNVKSYGDTYYDLAKLRHSTQHGYEYLITDNFTLEQLSSNSFNLRYINNNHNDVDQLFLAYVDHYSYNLDKIDVLQGTIYIGMCARHYDSLERQKAMYLIGLSILNKIYDTI